MRAKARAHSPVPAHAIEVDRIGLRRVDRDVEGDALVLGDACHRRVSLDLPGRIVPQLRVKPAGGAGLLVLQDHRIGVRALRARTLGVAAVRDERHERDDEQTAQQSANRQEPAYRVHFNEVHDSPWPVASSRPPLRTDSARSGGSHITRSRANHSWQTRQRVRGVNQPRAEISACDMFVRIEEWRSSGSACRTIGRAHVSRLTASPTISEEIRFIRSLQNRRLSQSRLRKVMFITTFFTRSVAVSLPCARRGEVNDHPFSEDQAKVHCHRVAGKPCG